MLLVLLILLILLVLLTMLMFDVPSIVRAEKCRALAGDAVNFSAGCLRIFVHPLVRLEIKLPDLSMTVHRSIC